MKIGSIIYIIILYILLQTRLKSAILFNCKLANSILFIAFWEHKHASVRTTFFLIKVCLLQMPSLDLFRHIIYVESKILL